MESEVWTRYWAGGREDSFADGGAADGLPEIDAVWRAWLAGLPDGAALADLATGGGHVLRLALAVAREGDKAFALTGIDLADIAPLRARFADTGRATLTLQGRTALGDLPLADGAFDAVTSQFGIEYAPRDPACTEAVRVLKPGGAGLFVLHLAGGAIAAAAEARLRGHRRILPDDAPFLSARRLFAALSAGASGPPADRLAAEFAAAVQAAAQRVTPDPALSNTREIVSFLADLARTPGRYDPKDALRRLRFAQEEIGAWLARQQALVDCALTDEGVAGFARALQSAGAETEAPQRLESGGAPVAWLLRFAKPARAI